MSNGCVDPGSGVGAGARDTHGWEGEFDAAILEGGLDQRVGPPADNELFARLGHHLHPDLDSKVAELFDALHFQRLDDLWSELGVGSEFRADAFDDYLHRGKV